MVIIKLHFIKFIINLIIKMFIQQQLIIMLIIHFISILWISLKPINYLIKYSIIQYYLLQLVTIILDFIKFIINPNTQMCFQQPVFMVHFIHFISIQWLSLWPIDDLINFLIVYHVIQILLLQFVIIINFLT